MSSIVNAIFEVGQKERLINCVSRIYRKVRHRDKSSNYLMSFDSYQVTGVDTYKAFPKSLNQRQGYLIPDRKLGDRSDLILIEFSRRPSSGEPRTYNWSRPGLDALQRLFETTTEFPSFLNTGVLFSVLGFDKNRRESSSTGTNGQHFRRPGSIVVSGRHEISTRSL